MNGVFVLKAWAILASKISERDRDTADIGMAKLGARLVERRAALGNPIMPRNSGKNRTLSKIALLNAINDAGSKW